VHRRRHGHRHVHCTRLNNRQSDRLNDEKIICQLQTTLIKKKMPGLAPGIFISGVSERSGDPS